MCSGCRMDCDVLHLNSLVVPVVTTEPVYDAASVSKYVVQGAAFLAFLAVLSGPSMTISWFDTAAVEG